MSTTIIIILACLQVSTLLFCFWIYQSLKNQNQQEGVEQLKEEIGKQRDNVSHTLLQFHQSINENLLKGIGEVKTSLGEMNSVAQTVDKLQKVLTNVKAKGVFGEFQLEALLEQSMAPGQYQKNVMPVPGSRSVVEFAIALPGKSHGETVWVPLDSKFPTSSYQEIIEATETGDREAVSRAEKSFERSLVAFAKDIRSKYIHPPHTTDFGLLYVPLEGIYNQVVKNDLLFQRLLTEMRVVVVGPTTLTAFLSSLSMGFRTLVVEKQASEVWKTLSSVKREVLKFSELIEEADKKLISAQKANDKLRSKTNTVLKALASVEQNENSELENDQINLVG